MNKILVLRNKRVFKGLFIHLIGCEHDQDLGPPFSYVFNQVGHWSTYLEKTPHDYPTGQPNVVAPLYNKLLSGSQSVVHCNPSWLLVAQQGHRFKRNVKP